MSDDVYDVDDLRTVLARLQARLGSRDVVVGVALAVVAVCLALAVLPHVFGAFGAEPIDTGIGPTPDDSGAGAQQRYQNYLTSFLFTFGPIVLPALATVVAFAAGLRRRDGDAVAGAGTIAVGAAVGMTLGYAAFAVVAHLAYGEAPGGYYIESTPVAIRPVVTVVNALALAAVTGVTSALAGFAGGLLAADSRGQQASAAGAQTAAGRTADGGGQAPAASEDDDRSFDTEDFEGREDPGSDATDDGDDVDAEGERERGDGDDDSGSRSPQGASGPASDYRETGPTRGSTPGFDPSERDWDGNGDDDRD
jgi:hypothetical protein